MIEAFLSYVEETTSTNDDMMRRILEDAPHGSAIYAGTQHKGRGRQGRPWAGAPKQNLALSVGIVGRQYAPHLTMIPLAVGVAMAEQIEANTGIHTDLKWPNDLLVNQKKLGGILCEGVHQGTQFKGAVIGVGINLNMHDEDLERAALPMATSLRIESGQTVDVDTFAERARLRIVQEVDALLSGGRAQLLARWTQRDVTQGRRVHLLNDDRYGTAEGIDREGALRVRLDDGRYVHVRSGEVHLLQPKTA